MIEATQAEAIVRGFDNMLIKLDTTQFLRMSEMTTLDDSEHFDAQTLQSVAFAEGIISLGVASFLYNRLGETTSHFDNSGLSDRLAVIAILAKIGEVRKAKRQTV